MKKLLLIPLMLLLQSFPSFADLKGKSLICECLYKTESNSKITEKCDILGDRERDEEDMFSLSYKFYKFIQFDDDKLTFSSLLNKRDRFSFKDKKIEYGAAHSFIIFSFDKKTYGIERLSLRMSSNYANRQYHYKCNLFNDPKTFAYEKDMLLGEVQNKYNLSLKENKL